MKRNSAGFLALFLSAAMTVSPVLSYAGEPGAETEICTEAAADQTEDVQEEDVQAEIAALPIEMSDVQSVESDESENKDTMETEEPDQAEELQEENLSEEAAETENSTAEENLSQAVAVEENSEIPIQKSAADVPTFLSDASVVSETAVKVVKADGTEFKMFAAAQSSAALNGDKIDIVFVTKNVSYDGIYVGSLEDAEKSPVQEGVFDEAEASWTFKFQIPASLSGQKAEIVLRKKDGTFYSNQPLYLDVPQVGGAVIPTEPTTPIEPEKPSEGGQEEAPSSSLTVVYGSGAEKAGEEFGMFRVVESSIEAKDGSYVLTIATEKTTYYRLHMGTIADAEPYAEDTMIDGVENALGGYTFTLTVPASAKDQDVSIVPIKSKDGTAYTGNPLVIHVPTWPEIPEDSSEGDQKEEAAVQVPEDGTYDVAGVSTGSSMFRVVNCLLKVTEGKMTAEIALSGTGYDYLYMGTPSEAFAAEESSWIPFEEKTVLNTETDQLESKYVYTIPVEALDTPLTVAARSAKNAAAGKGEEAWYPREITIPSDSLILIEPEKPDPTETVLEDGIYNASDVQTGSQMFRVVNCQLTSEDGSMTAEIALSGTGYDVLFMGSPSDAAAAEERDLIPYEVKTVFNNETNTEEEKYVYTIPIDVLDTAIQLSARSAKNGTWYERSITISSEGLTKIAGLPGSGEVVDPENPSDKPETKPETKPEDDKKEETEKKPEEESKHEADTSGSTSRVDNSTGLKDGVYNPDSFSFSGGSGKTTISCRQITIKGGQAYVTLIFSSASGRNKMEYVKANGQTYYTSENGGTRVVTIPVALNKNNRIIAMTTAMGTPHEVAYNIYVALAAANGNTVSQGAIGTGNAVSDTLDEKAPEILGLTFEDETTLDYAEGFKMYHYSDGITLLEVDMTTEEEEEAEAEETEEEEEETLSPEERTAALYQQKVVKYLIVPEDIEIPAGLEKEVVVIQLPADHSYVASEEALAVMKDLELLDQITAIGFEAEELEELGYMELAEQLLTGEEEETDDETPEGITFAGAFDELDFELLEENENNFIILPEEILPAKPEEDAEEAEEDAEEILTLEEQKERLAEMALSAAELGIPMLVDRSANEKYVLGTLEWIKVYGAIYGISDKTDQIYEKAVKEAKEAGTLTKENVKPEKK